MGLSKGQKITFLGLIHTGIWVEVRSLMWNITAPVSGTKGSWTHLWMLHCFLTAGFAFLLSPKFVVGFTPKKEWIVSFVVAVQTQRELIEAFFVHIQGQNISILRLYISLILWVFRKWWKLCPSSPRPHFTGFGSTCLTSFCLLYITSTCTTGRITLPLCWHKSRSVLTASSLSQREHLRFIHVFWSRLMLPL